MNINQFKQYKILLVSNPSLLGFGFIMTLYSSFGQTFFIGIFGPSVQAELGLNHTAWASIYMLGTVASALLMPMTGKLIDHYRLPGHSVAVCALLAVACAFTSLVTGPVTLVVAIFLLRHSGQGLANHISSTSMGRYFHRDRGQALAISSLGMTTGEAVLPFLAIAAISMVGWRWTFGVAALIVAVTSFPVVMWLLRGYDHIQQQHIKTQHASVDPTQPNALSITRHQMLRDTRFYMILPGLLAPSMIGTALFFHHLNIAAAKHWDATWVTGNYVVYATASLAAMLTAGTLIDQFTAKRVVQFILIPLALAALTIGTADQHLWIIPYMLLLGLHTGFTWPALSALWAELYGVKHLGSIKGLFAGLTVMASAVGPFVVGSMMDSGFSIENICYILAGGTLLANIPLSVGLRSNTSKHI